MTAGILFSQMEPPAELSDEFDHWYEADHIPARMALPGFVGARRYRAESGMPWHLAIYELDDLTALATSEYLALKAAPSPLTVRMLGLVHGFTRFTCALITDDTADPRPGAHLRVDALQVREGAEREFEERYDRDVPGSGLFGVLRRRRFAVVDGDGGPWTHLVLDERDGAAIEDSTTDAGYRPPWCLDRRSWSYTVLSSHSADANRDAS